MSNGILPGNLPPKKRPVKAVALKRKEKSDHVEDRRHQWESPLGTVDMRGYGTPEGQHSIPTDIAGGLISFLDQAGLGYGDNAVAGIMSMLPNRGTFDQELALAKNLQNRYRDNHPIRNNALRATAMLWPGGLPRTAFTKAHEFMFNAAANPWNIWAPRALLGLLATDAYGLYHHAVANTPRDSKKEMKRRKGFDKQGDFK